MIDPKKRMLWHLYEQKRRSQYLPLDQLLDRQTDKLRRLLKIAYRAPYYKGLLNSAGVSVESFNLHDLKKLPVLTKEIIRREKQGLLSASVEQLFPNSSGGSTGEPINFYQDQNYKDHTWATMMVSMEMCGWYYGARVARLWGAPQDTRSLSSLKGKIALFAQNTRFYDTFDISLKKMEAYHQDLSKFQPDVIVSYASSIHLLAQYLLKNGIVPAYPKLSVISSAETLYQDMRETIEKVFRVKCFDKYGSREVSAVACECDEHSGLHIFMDNVIIECVDPKTGQEVFDEPGEIIVTDLNNYGMPFIRYKIGDIGILTNERCSCGRTTLKFKRIIGRATDNFILRDGKIIHGEFFTHLFYGLHGIREFQFVQESLEDFNLYIVKNEDLVEGTIKFLYNEIIKTVGGEARVQIHFVDSVPKTPTGKYKFTISRVKINEALKV